MPEHNANEEVGDSPDRHPFGRYAFGLAAACLVPTYFIYLYFSKSSYSDYAIMFSILSLMTMILIVISDRLVLTLTAWVLIAGFTAINWYLTLRFMHPREFQPIFMMPFLMPEMVFYRTLLNKLTALQQIT
ncbi:hypothetical protein [Sphingomonas trueperi]|uniref:hypothetical protein n=1 Tax=Sphingomonas trueperi TaxID=53317 RepID=UPI000F281F6C